jgi:hypothetical protein
MTNSEGGSVLPGLQSLWAETTGSLDVVVVFFFYPSPSSTPTT